MNTASSLVHAFQATTLLAVMMTLTKRHTLEHVIAVSAHWLWFSVVLNIVVIFWHFAYPTQSVFGTALCAVAVLYVFSVGPHRVLKLSSRIVGLSTLMVLSGWVTKVQIMTDGIAGIPSDVLFATFVSLAIIAAVVPSDRLLLLNMTLLVQEGFYALMSWNHHKTNVWFTSETVFGVYWLTVLMLLLVNYTETKVVFKKAMRSS